MSIKALRYIIILIGFLSIFFSCQEDHITPPTEGATPIKEYFIAAEEVEWNYSPSQTNLAAGRPYSPDELVYLENAPQRIGRKNIKARYRLYKDAGFTEYQSTTDDSQAGILGPVIRAEVGDQIKITFKNNTGIAASMHPHGVKYDKLNEGITGVAPGETFVYTWEVPENAGPASGEGSSVAWAYHSHVMENLEGDLYAGLIGPLVIYRKGALENNKAKDVDAERFALFMVLDESSSLYLDNNISNYTDGTVDKSDPDFQESNKKHSVNGLMYGNQNFSIKAGMNVRWYLLAFGNEVDWHTAHWHGNTATFRGSRTDVIQLGPASMVVADMRADNPGTWMFHCHVHDHTLAGMDASYTVEQ